MTALNERALEHGMFVARQIYSVGNLPFDSAIRAGLEAALAYHASEPDAVAVERAERRVYRNTPEFADYLSARFADRARNACSFEYDGHRWAYQHTSFDDTGEYDLLWRPTARSQP